MREPPESAWLSRSARVAGSAVVRLALEPAAQVPLAEAARRERALEAETQAAVPATVREEERRQLAQASPRDLPAALPAPPAPEAALPARCSRLAAGLRPTKPPPAQALPAPPPECSSA